MVGLLRNFSFFLFSFSFLWQCHASAVRVLDANQKKFCSPKWLSMKTTFVFQELDAARPIPREIPTLPSFPVIFKCDLSKSSCCQIVVNFIFDLDLFNRSCTLSRFKR